MQDDVTIAAVTTDRLYRQKTRLLSASVGDQVIMMSVELGRYFNLNPVAGRIWQLLATPCSLDRIVAELAPIYDAPEETIRAEAAHFLTRLEREGLLIVTAAGEG
ncbi:PqqD family peptide modification chaperone [Tistrella mobilis]|uniref:PqqD family peptide modification chaperone n=1 Tax=Tistrella mobilis TaxID=171437 RepID=UPI003556093E